MEYAGFVVFCYLLGAITGSCVTYKLMEELKANNRLNREKE
jgi:uncharacterized protein YneF (UPF0154 family)